MALKLFLSDIKFALREWERILFYPFTRFPGENFCLVGISDDYKPQRQQNSSESFLNDFILWAVPKKRRSLEVRRGRKFGCLQQMCKTLIPKKDILVCIYCSHDYEKGHLCPNCYNRAKKETQEMQAAIEEALGIDPVEQEVVVLYEGEKEKGSSEFFEGKQIVEMKKERPAWFSRNLLQGSTAEPSKSTDVIPENLA